jgi:hypothetical protein
MKTLAQFLLVCSLVALPAIAQRGGGMRGGGGSHGGGGFRGGGGFHGGGGGFHGGVGGFRGGGFGGSGFRGHGGFGGFGRGGFYGGFRGSHRGFYGHNRFFFGLGFYPYSSWPYYSYWPNYDWGYPSYGYGYAAPSYDYGSSYAPPVIINQYDMNQYDPAPPTVYQPPPSRPRPDIREYPENSSSRPYEKPIYLIAFKNQENIRAAEAYWVEGSTLHYVTLQHEQRQSPLDSVDRALTYRLNRERHLDFRLPPQ